jgi:NADH dehydrogenase
MPSIVVLGAGYTGMAATMSLAGRLRRRTDVRITLVNGSDRFTERLRLHQLASGQQLADLRIPTMLAGTGVKLETGWVTNIDARARQIRVDDERVLPYDTLVYALGGTADTGTVPGADEHAYTLDSAEHADALARRLADLESIAVCGTGFTGVEAAAEIAERHPHLRVVLIGRSEPGATMTPKARAYLGDALRRLKVEVRSGVEIVKILPGGVALAGGDSVDVEAVLWTGGVRVSPLAAAAGLAVDGHGRIVTDAALRSVSHPSVYAIGDAAAIRQGYGTMHGTCQGGIPTGVHAAASIARELAGAEPKPFRFGYVHMPVSLGRNDAVIQFTRPDDSAKRLYLTGRRAIWYKETVSASPWTTFRQLLKAPAVGMFTWRRGGRYTR